MNLNCVDLFCGAGGMSLGFRQAGFNIVAAVDKSDGALETYRQNFPEVKALNRDIKETSAQELLDDTDYSKDDIDVVIGGPPCKGFSHAGKMDPSDPRNKLIANYISIIRILEPDTIVMENVRGILDMEGGKYKHLIIDAFREAGYSIPDEPPVLNAADYGVPQTRSRVFFCAAKDEILMPPEPTHYDPSAQDEEGETDHDRAEYITVSEAISDLAYLTVGGESTEYQQAATTEYQHAMRERSELLANHEASNHCERVQERFAQLDPGEDGDDLPEEYQTKKHSLRRWDPGQPAPTVTTLPDDFVHYNKPRIPTVRELARLQSFPDWFEFHGNRTTGGSRRRTTTPQYSQVGNAVPVRVARAVAGAIKEHVAHEPEIKLASD